VTRQLLGKCDGRLTRTRHGTEWVALLQVVRYRSA
jgi:hypothetical protein